VEVRFVLCRCGFQWDCFGSPFTMLVGWTASVRLWLLLILFLPIFSVSPPLSSFSSLLCLLSWLCAIVFLSFVLQCFDSNLLLFCSLNPVSYYTQFYRVERVGPSSFSVSANFLPTPDVVLTYTPRSGPDRRATAYSTNVFSSEV